MTEIERIGELERECSALKARLRAAGLLPPPCDLPSDSGGRSAIGDRGRHMAEAAANGSGAAPSPRVCQRSAFLLLRAAHAEAKRKFRAKLLYRGRERILQALQPCRLRHRQGDHYRNVCIRYPHESVDALAVRHGICLQCAGHGAGTDRRLARRAGKRLGAAARSEMGDATDQAANAVSRGIGRGNGVR